MPTTTLERADSEGEQKLRRGYRPDAEYQIRFEFQRVVVKKDVFVS